MANPNTLSKLNHSAFLLVCLLLYALLGFSNLYALSRGFNTDDAELKAGMAAALTTDSDSDEAKVERASTENAERVVGIVTTTENSSVTVSSGTKQVLVETSGEATAYVSDINGVVKQGDLVRVSPLKGILMKSEDSTGVIIGVALADAATEGDSTHTVALSGDTKSAVVSSVKISLDRKAALTNVPVDSSLERLGKAIVGKDVSEVRVAVALLIFTMVLIAEGSIIYGAVSSAITALGRNPLAKDVIRSETFRVLTISVTVLVIGLAAIYIILWV